MEGTGKRKADCPGLPSGWTREECVRHSGLSAGKTDVYYFRSGKQAGSQKLSFIFVGTM